MPAAAVTGILYGLTYGVIFVGSIWLGGQLLRKGLPNGWAVFLAFGAALAALRTAIKFLFKAEKYLRYPNPARQLSARYVTLLVGLFAGAAVGLYVTAEAIVCYE